QTIFKCKDSQPFKLTAEVGATNQYVIWQTSLDGFTWTNVTQGQVYEITHDRFTPGSYYYRYLTAGDEFNIQNEKCRVISDAVLVEVVKDVYEKYDTICLGNKYSFAAKNLDSIGDYTHTFVSSLGCDSTVNLHLHVVNANGLQTNALFDEPKCFGTATGKIIDLQSSGGHPPYITSVMNAESVTENDLEKLKEGVYDINIKDRHGCFSKEQIVLTDPPLFEIKSLSDTVVELGESIKLSVSTNYSPKDISWDSPDFSSKELEPIYIPTTSNILNLIAFNANDCRAGDTISITVNRDYRIYYPNILSFGSSDGNDEFFFKSFNNIIQSIVVFEVYDRYGNIVEKVDNVNPEYIWQGKSKAKPILTGVYPFVVKLLLINGEIINRSGTITIVD
ncbi:MAG TPA: gliding motility-associated C-terminal domain-containing protein, partial [Saprospiraceae bacterium]|nr:gliding motility-associated C-terminal domain-containing protein [Saprospiraceae bacterium]